MEIWLRCIGDCHGRHTRLVELCKESTYSLCVGDIGFNYKHLEKGLEPCSS